MPLPPFFFLSLTERFSEINRDLYIMLPRTNRKKTAVELRVEAKGRQREREREDAALQNEI